MLGGRNSAATNCRWQYQYCCTRGLVQVTQQSADVHQNSDTNTMIRDMKEGGRAREACEQGLAAESECSATRLSKQVVCRYYGDPMHTILLLTHSRPTCQIACDPERHDA